MDQDKGELVPETLSERLDSTEFLTMAINKAVRAAILDHKKAGNPVATWKDGCVVIVPPEEISAYLDETDKIMS